ncbi:MAG: hypothetical protein L0Y72_05565 [Gemmataceae bacterium]|nr:hypothetical protein [Gemmataceae bacterium]MCI0738492.1 hypothetical protein [Gemmataceae bacterium]
MQRGTTLELALTGSNLAGPTGFWAAFPSKSTIPTEDKNGQDNAKLKVRLEAPADAPIGAHVVRLTTTRGISNLRLFCIDDLPQVLENDKNRSWNDAMPTPVPSVVAGKADAEASDYFKISVQSGQRLSFDLLGRRLGSAIDAQLSIYSAKTKRELAHDNDSPGCQTDPRLTFTFKEAGDYLIEVKDVLNRGGADYGYRLRIGDFPLAVAPIPMAAKRGINVQVHFAGPNVEGVQPAVVSVPADPFADVVWVAPKGPSGLHGWPVALAVTDTEELLEQEPNNEPGKAQRLPVPGGVTGRFQQSDDTDCYLLSAKKGQKLSVEADTLELYSPTLVYIVLKNAKTGAEIAKTNPQSPPPADQRIEFTAADDGDYLVEVQHLNYLGGPSESYHLTVTPVTPTFEIALGIERFDVAPNSIVSIPLTVIRKGFAGPIDVSLQLLPSPQRSEVSGNLIGFTTIKPGQNSGVLVVSTQNAALGPNAAVVVARATIDGKTVTQRASVRAVVSAALGNLSFPPLDLNHRIAVGVKEMAPFSLAAKMSPPEATPGIATQVTLLVTRNEGFAEEIVFNAPGGLPPNVPAPKLANLAKDKNELKFSLDVNAKAPIGEYQLLFSAKAKSKDKEYSANALPLVLNVGNPFELKVEPAILSLKPGQKGKLKVTATRRGGYQGPIALEVRKLPAEVTASKGAIDKDKNSFELDVTATDKAAPGDKTGVDVNGTATALNNLQNGSPAFTVRIEKK